MKTKIRAILKQWNFVNKRNSIEIGYIDHEDKLKYVHVEWFKYITNEEEIVEYLENFAQRNVKEWLTPKDVKK